MKGKINTITPISGTETLTAGTEVEIVDVRYGCETYYMCIIPDGRRILIEAIKVDITDYTPFIDWSRLRIEFAGKAMHGILSNDHSGLMDYPEEYEFVADESVKFADALIEKLKNNHHG